MYRVDVVELVVDLVDVNLDIDLVDVDLDVDRVDVDLVDILFESFLSHNSSSSSLFETLTSAFYSIFKTKSSSILLRLESKQIRPFLALSNCL